MEEDTLAELRGVAARYDVPVSFHVRQLIKEELQREREQGSQ